jgi:hypothetical protein
VARSVRWDYVRRYGDLMVARAVWLVLGAPTGSLLDLDVVLRVSIRGGEAMGMGCCRPHKAFRLSQGAG